MPDPPYSQIKYEELPLRDHLAVDRTVLANERTLLAYIRTALGFLILGLTFLHFLDWWVYHLAAVGILAVGAVVLLVGIGRFLGMRKDLVRLRRNHGPQTGSEPTSSIH